MFMNILVLILSYLFGSIPWALVIGKVFYGKDIRQYGSGNLGASTRGHPRSDRGTHGGRQDGR